MNKSQMNERIKLDHLYELRPGGLIFYSKFNQNVTIESVHVDLLNDNIFIFFRYLPDDDSDWEYDYAELMEFRI